MKRTARILILVLALAGLGVSLYLTQYHFRILSDPAFESACKVNETFNCDKVNTSPWAKLWGIPLALYGAGYYLAMGLLAGLAFSQSEKYTRALELIFGFSFLAVLLSAGLAYVSAFQIGAWCLFCMSLYAVNLGMLGLAYVGSEGSLGSIVGRIDKELAGILRSPMLYLVGAVFAGVVFLGGSYYKVQVVEAEKQQAEKFLADKAPRELKSPAATSGGPGEPTKAAGHSDGDGHDHAKGADADVLQPEVVTFKRAGHEPVNGPKNAPVAIVIFSDFQCPYCQVAGGVLEEVVRQNPGKVSVTYYHYPLDMDCNPYMGRPLHEFSCRASVASICAEKQGQFWEMHDELFRNQKAISPELISQASRTLGLDITAFQTCMDDRSNYSLILSDIEQGKVANLTGTPSIFINGQKWKGMLSPEALTQVVRQLAGG